MTMRYTTTAATIFALCTLATPTAAQEQNPAVAARQAHMQLYGFNAGPIGGMARGKMPYDAAVAQAAADNIVALASLDQSRYWPEGTDNFEITNTRALPEIWENLPDVGKKVEDLRTAALALQAVAGDGPEALGPAAGALFGACNACHKAYRLSDN